MSRDSQGTVGTVVDCILRMLSVHQDGASAALIEECVERECHTNQAMALVVTRMLVKDGRVVAGVDGRGRAVYTAANG